MTGVDLSSDQPSALARRLTLAVGVPDSDAMGDMAVGTSSGAKASWGPKSQR